MRHGTFNASTSLYWVFILCWWSVSSDISRRCAAGVEIPLPRYSAELVFPSIEGFAFQVLLSSFIQVLFFLLLIRRSSVFAQLWSVISYCVERRARKSPDVSQNVWWILFSQRSPLELTNLNICHHFIFSLQSFNAPFCLIYPQGMMSVITIVGKTWIWKHEQCLLQFSDERLQTYDICHKWRLGLGENSCCCVYCPSTNLSTIQTQSKNACRRMPGLYLNNFFFTSATWRTLQNLSPWYTARRVWEVFFLTFISFLLIPTSPRQHTRREAPEEQLPVSEAEIMSSAQLARLF